MTITRVPLSQYVAYLHVEDSVSAITLHRVELQVSLEVLSVEPGDGQAVAKASLERTRHGSKLWLLQQSDKHECFGKFG
jgi:hypothetical protein